MKTAKRKADMSAWCKIKPVAPSGALPTTPAPVSTIPSAIISSPDKPRAKPRASDGKPKTKPKAKPKPKASGPPAKPMAKLVQAKACEDDDEDTGTLLAYDQRDVNFSEILPDDEKQWEEVEEPLLEQDADSIYPSDDDSASGRGSLFEDETTSSRGSMCEDDVPSSTARRRHVSDLHTEGRPSLPRQYRGRELVESEEDEEL